MVLPGSHYPFSQSQPYFVLDNIYLVMLVMNSLSYEKLVLNVNVML
jgi:hypothetical protein